MRPNSSTAGAVHWRLLLTEPLTGAANMALDEALMERARATGEATFRLYGWSRRTLSLGRNQPAAGRYDVERARECGVDIVRRPTGGRAVLHHREITYSVTAPCSVLGTFRESYARINLLLIDGLRRLGATASLADPRRRTASPSPLPCFESPATGEIVAEGRKLVGSAQWRERDALLQHGSILVDDDQWLASALLTRPAEPPPAPATLRALLGRAPSLDDAAAAFGSAIESAEGASPKVLDCDDELRRSVALARHTYEAEAWTWRR